MSAETASAAGTLTHREIMRVVSGVILGMLLAALDQTVLATALPVIAGELHGLRQLSWIVTIYLLTSTAMTPIYGKLSDLYGRRVMLEIAIAIFVIASALCGSAHSMRDLIIARGLQGVGGGGLISMAQTVLADVISPRERGRYQVYFSGMWAAASVGGPVLGGYFVQYLTWRWVFWINLPVGFAAFALCHRALAHLHVGRQGRRVDVLGAVLLLPMVSLLLLVAAWGGTELPWTSPLILGLLGAGLFLMAAFALQELRAPEAILPPRLFTNSVILLSSLIGFIMSMVMFSSTVLLPVFLQLVAGTSAGGSGLLITPLIGGTVAGAYPAGQLMRWSGRYRWILFCGIPMAIAGFLLLATMNAATPGRLSALYMLVLGVGIGSTGPTMMVAAQNASEGRDIGAATGLSTFFRTLGGSFGAAILWSILLYVLSRRLAEAGLNDTGLAADLLHGEAGNALSGSAHATLIAALTHAFHVAFVVAAGVAASALPLALLLKDLPLRTSTASAHTEPAV